MVQPFLCGQGYCKGLLKIGDLIFESLFHSFFFFLLLFWNFFSKQAFSPFPFSSGLQAQPNWTSPSESSPCGQPRRLRFDLPASLAGGTPASASPFPSSFAFPLRRGQKRGRRRGGGALAS